MLRIWHQMLKPELVCCRYEFPKLICGCQTVFYLICLTIKSKDDSHTNRKHSQLNSKISKNGRNMQKLL